ncbi:MAG: cell division protein SepF [Acidimicrobiia bacterium]|nr:cell division protein SepF [Acidimicrobiia bacterium]MYC56989.1 cell division protein SepF [Acidimicrobiia bacterium]MYG94079.1 cell division protein SepF [Acidimicrobiia bacterium]MYI30854.1 cell division protein SepF [Acidimicrobiia bacterium]
MSSVWQKTKYWLGFGTEEEFGQMVAPEYEADMRLVSPMSESQASSDADSGSVRPLQEGAAAFDGAAGSDSARTSFVRPVSTTSTKPSVVTPVSFDDAKDVGDCFRTGLAVIVNLQHSTREVARRLIDFSSGLCYGLDGRMERVADQVYLLTPSNVEVSDEERRRMKQADYQETI